MAAGQFRTELPTMQQSASRVLDVNGQIQSDLSSLMSRLEPLLSSWQGEASGSFSTVKERWNANAVKLNNALRGIAETLQANERNYATSEQTNTSGFNQISAVL